VGVESLLLERNAYHAVAVTEVCAHCIAKRDIVKYYPSSLFAAVCSAAEQSRESLSVQVISNVVLVSQKSRVQRAAWYDLLSRRCDISIFCVVILLVLLPTLLCNALLVTDWRQRRPSARTDYHPSFTRDGGWMVGGW
jgi:hypothetical protein